MTAQDQQRLGKTLWNITDLLLGAMNADDFCDELIASEARKLEALKTRKKGLMQQLFPSPEEASHL